MRRMQDAIDEYPLVSSESKVIRVNETHRVAFVPVILSVSVEVDGKMTPEPFEIYAQIGAFFAFKHFNERNGVILPWLPRKLERCDLFLETAFRDSSFNPLKAAKSYFDFVMGNREHSLQHMSPLASYQLLQHLCRNSTCEYSGECMGRADYLQSCIVSFS